MGISMSKRIALLLVFVLAVSGIITLLPVYAASRVIVVPDDYPTIAAAVGNATQGDTVYVKKGTYEEETLEINKPLSIIGEGTELTKINLHPPLSTEFDEAINFTFSWYETAITVNTNDFKLSGFTINTPDVTNIVGGEFAIIGNKTQVLGNSITTPFSVNGSYSTITENIFSKTAAFGSHSNIINNTVLGDVSIVGSHSNIINNKFSGTIWAWGSYLNISANKVGTVDSGVRLEGSFCIVYDNNLIAEGLYPAIAIEGDGNIVASNFVDRSDIGIRIDGSNNTVYANRITNSLYTGYFSHDPNPNTGIGVIATGSNTFYANYVADNDWGIKINQFPETNVTSIFYHNNFVDNTHQVAIDNNYTDIYGSDNFDNGEEGNFWSDYNGADANGDGIGDTPYIIDAKRQDNYPLMTPFDIDNVIIELPDWTSSEPRESETQTAAFPTLLVATSVCALTPIIGISLFIYFKKRKH